MIRPIAHGQTRFTVPGLVPDAQGIAIAPEATALLPTIGHLVGFLRSVSREQPLKTALPELRLARARLAGGGPIALAEFAGRGAHALDRAAALVRLHQGQLYVGENEHRVRFRDPSASWGYDSNRLLESRTGRVLYDRPVDRTVSDLRPLAFDRLVSQLALSRRHGDEVHPELFLRAPSVLTLRLVRHLLGRGATIRVAQLQPQETAATSAAAEVLIGARRVPAGLWPMLRGLPGVRLFRREQTRIFVESGWAHPLDLAGCAGLLAGEQWMFFVGNGGGVETMAPVHRFGQGADLLQPTLITPEERNLEADETGELDAVTYPIRLSQRQGAQGATVARLLRGPRAFAWLERLVYLAPPEVLASAQVVAWQDHVVVIGTDGGPPVPVGEPLRALGPSVFAPVDHTLTPRLSPRRVQAVLAPEGGALMLPDRVYRWPAGAELPLERRVISQLALADVQAESISPEPVGLVQPTHAGAFRGFLEGLR